MSLAAKQSRSTLDLKNNAGSNPGYLVISKPSLAEKIPRTLKFRNPKKEKIVNYNYLSNLANSGFTKNTSTNLERSHRLPHVCTKIKYGKLRVHRLKDTYVRAQLWHNLPRRYCYLERSHQLPRVFTISRSRCPSLRCLVLPEFLGWPI